MQPGVFYPVSNPFPSPPTRLDKTRSDQFIPPGRDLSATLILIVRERNDNDVLFTLFQMVQAIQVLRFHLLELEKVSIQLGVDDGWYGENNFILRNSETCSHMG